MTNDKENVERVIKECRTAHAAYVEAGIDGFEGARWSGMAADALENLLAERDALKADRQRMHRRAQKAEAIAALPDAIRQLKGDE